MGLMMLPPRFILLAAGNKAVGRGRQMVTTGKTRTSHVVILYSNLPIWIGNVRFTGT